jgi:HlyD family secretion protein
MPAERGTVALTVSATGTIEPVTKVAVGSQVSGTISWLGADFNDHVKKGEVIAQLDPSLFRTAVAQGEANLARARAAYANATRTWQRSKELAARGVLAQVELDAAQASYEQTQAEVKQAAAALSNSQVNLAHATISSPIDGVVIARSVDVGQTVAASMQAPSSSRSRAT